MSQTPYNLSLEIINALKNPSIGRFVEDISGYWIYRLGVTIEINSTIYSGDNIREVESYLREELDDNRLLVRLQLVAEHPLEGEGVIISVEQLPKNRPFRVRKQTLDEFFLNDLRREGYLREEHLVRRVEVQFHQAICEKLSGRSIDDSFFQAELDKYAPDSSFYRIREAVQPIDRGYGISELEEVPIMLPDQAGDIQVAPFEIRNRSSQVVHFEMPNLYFSSVKGVALLPGQPLKVFQELDLEIIRRQLEESKREENGDYFCKLQLPASEFDLLPRQSIVFTPLSRPFRAKPRTYLFSSEQEKYQLFYVGACMRALRTELYISNLFTPDFKPPIAITVGYTEADRARWYTFNQLCEFQVSPSRTPFRILPGYLFKASPEQFHIRNIHLAFHSIQTGKNINGGQRCEILLESSANETIVKIEEPKPALIAAFCEHDVPDIRLGRDRFQLRIARSYRKISLQTGAQSTGERKSSLEIREGAGIGNRPWNSVAFDQPFMVGHHILKVVTN
jgi:hypothetical protein